MRGAMVGDNALVVIDQSHIIPRVAIGMPPLRTNIVDPHRITYSYDYNNGRNAHRPAWYPRRQAVTWKKCKPTSNLPTLILYE